MSKEKKVVDPHAPLKHKGLGALEAARKELAEREAAEAKAKKQPAKPAPRPAPAKKPQDEVWRPDLDKDLLAIALSGVVRLDKAQGARKAQGAAVSNAAAKARRVAAQGDEGLAVRWTEQGDCEAVRKGRAFALEGLGRFVEAEETLDLHGLDEATALLRVQEFVRSRRARGRRVVAVVHGRGLHSPDGKGVLRDAAVRALSEVPGCAEVDAFRGEAGSAVLLVALRKGR